LTKKNAALVKKLIIASNITTLLLAAAMAVLMLFACAPADWRHASKGLAELAMDQAECERLARARAVEASHGKTRMVQKEYSREFYRCMAMRGWTRGRQEAQAKPPATRIGQGRVTGLGLAFALPSGYAPIASDTGVMDQSAFSRHVFSGPGGRSLVLVFQQGQRNFSNWEFPAPSGYAVYDRGSEGGAGWACFTGMQAGVPVVLIGAYVPAGKNGRVVVTAVSPSPDSGGPPPSSNLSLDGWQKTAAQGFTDNWTRWLRDNPTAAGER
jgi:hypothetical protein